jgi:IS30 family transposase
MEKRDARKLGLAAQAEVRRLAVAQRESGLTHGEIAKNLSVHRGTVTRWLNEYRRDAGAIGLRGVGALRGKAAIFCSKSLFCIVLPRFRIHASLEGIVQQNSQMTGMRSGRKTTMVRCFFDYWGRIRSHYDKFLISLEIL